MAHDVFISYASRDKPTADAACAILESNGVRCWIAPRDILPGRDWGEAIINAIEGARVMVLVFSGQANASRQIVREVERAVNKGLNIVTLRIEDVPPAGNLEYFLSTPHWLDALTPPLEQHLQYLSDTVRVLLGANDLVPVPPSPSPAWQQVLTRREVLIGAGGIAGVIGLAFATGVIGGGGGEEAEAAELDTRLVGDWNIESALTNSGDGSTTDWTISLARSGDYTGEMIVRDDGTVEPLAGSAEWLTLTPTRAPSGAMRSVSWKQNGDTAQVLTSTLVPGMLLQLLSSAGPMGSAGSFLSKSEEYRRTGGGSGSSINGRWQLDSDYGSMHWLIVVEITGSRTYRLEATLKDRGKMSTRDGTWRQVSEANGLQEGDYAIADQKTVVFRNSSLVAFGPTAQVTWRREGN